jgi:hypothetical protein
MQLVGSFQFLRQTNRSVQTVDLRQTLLFRRI